MAHYKTLLDPAKYLGAVDFPKEREVTISRAAREQLPMRKEEKEDPGLAPMLYILDKEGKEHHRPLKIPKSVLEGLALMLGPDYDTWVGKKVTLFATKCLSFGDVEECVRVRFPEEIERKVMKWLKKRKANPSCYILRERN